ncbi:MAG: acetyl-CoA carboxylase biotin carboxylase subunit [Ignavibacteria bacterium]|nr:acetyl-CoA carboxylase biotin carboxylase subunit [Ignavibacteria bacterium]
MPTGQNSARSENLSHRENTSPCGFHPSRGRHSRGKPNQGGACPKHCFSGRLSLYFAPSLYATLIHFSSVFRNVKIRSILVANRGEIAVRVIRACREMGIRAVAVYSDPDRAALHVRVADESYHIGPAASRLSYLDQDKLLAIAKQAHCDAIHPGYGFLSENAGFAQAVADAGLIFIGPPAAAIRSMGDKTSARRLMKERGVPVVPGTEDAITSLDEALVTADAIGYPVLVKAAAGGGGKGMRVVASREDLVKSVESAQNEARLAFGDDRVYIEKFVVKPRHIEFQIVADMHGNAVHLGERECSIQRRHQKVIEEAPSAIMTPELRERMGASAVMAAQACGYVNAGTIEFLVDHERNYFFLEMNTRLQVEHPVTEMVTGIDLVKLQIRIAEGEALPFAQKDVRFRGHAIEARLCAEDVRNNFFPSTGTLTRYKPSQGYGVREDSGVEEGSEISIHYDPMFAKLIAWGTDRADAIDKMRRALDEFRIVGVETTIPFCRFVMDNKQFHRGDFQIDFVEQHYRAEYLREPAPDELRAAAIAAVLLGRHARTQSVTVPAAGNGRSRWNARSRARD